MLIHLWSLCLFYSTFNFFSLIFFSVSLSSIYYLLLLVNANPTAGSPSLSDIKDDPQFFFFFALNQDKDALAIYWNEEERVEQVWGRRDQEFRFGNVKFEMFIGYSSVNQAVGQAVLSSGERVRLIIWIGRLFKAMKTRKITKECMKEIRRPRTEPLGSLTWKILGEKLSQCLVQHISATDFN